MSKGKYVSFHEQIRKQRKAQFICDMISGFLGGSSLALALCEGYYYYYESREIRNLDEPGPKGNTYIIVMGTPQESAKLFYMRLYISLASALLAIVLTIRYILEKKIQVATLKANGLWGQKYCFPWHMWIIEVAFALTFLPPYVNGVYQEEQTGVYVTTDMLITTIMTGRIYLVWRALYQLSSFHGKIAQAACAKENIKPTPWFVFKSELKQAPFILVGILLTLLFFIFGFGERQTELPYSFISGFDWDFIMNGVWNMFLTVTTVGYGDIFPQTSLGRVFCVVAAMLGSFFTSLLVIAISDYFSMSMKERNAVYRLKRRLALEELKCEAQAYIKWAWKYSFFVRPMRFYSSKEANKIHYNLCTAYMKFKSRRQKIWQDGEYAISEMDRGYYNVSDALSRNLMKTEMIMWDVRVFREKLNLLEKRQIQIEKVVDVLHNAYSSIENVTRPFTNPSQARTGGYRPINFTFSELGSLLQIDQRSITQEVKNIAEEIPYKFLATKIDTAFRFREQKGLLGPTPQRTEDKKKSMRAINRLERVTETTESETEKQKFLQSGEALTMLQSLFGKERAKSLYLEMKISNPKVFAKVVQELEKEVQIKNQDESNSSKSITPRPNMRHHSAIPRNPSDSGSSGSDKNRQRQRKALTFNLGAKSKKGS